MNNQAGLSIVLVVGVGCATHLALEPAPRPSRYDPAAMPKALYGNSRHTHNRGTRSMGRPTMHRTGQMAGND